MMLNDVKIKPDKSVKGILKVFGQELKALQMDLYDTLLQLLTSVCVRVCVRGSVQEWWKIPHMLVCLPMRWLICLNDVKRRLWVYQWLLMLTLLVQQINK